MLPKALGYRYSINKLDHMLEVEHIICCSDYNKQLELLREAREYDSVH